MRDPKKQQAAMAEAKAKYGDNHWWESPDERTLAYYQLNEDTLLIEWSLFRRALEQLLGRGVQTFEFGLALEGLRAEAAAAWNGVPYSRELKDAAESDAFDALEKHVGKDHIIVLGIDDD